MAPGDWSFEEFKELMRQAYEPDIEFAASLS